MKVLILLLFSAVSYAQDFQSPDLTNPFNGEEFSKVEVSDSYYFRRFRTEYYYRYVTLYNTRTEDKEFQEIPRVLEECFEASDRYAVWIIEREVQRTIQSSFGFNVLGIDLGLGGEVSRTFNFTFERFIQAQAGVRAIHIPLMRYDVHEGITYQQRYYPSSGKTQNIQLKNETFYVDMINPMFVAHREVLERCPID